MDQFSGVEQDDNSRVVDSLTLESPIHSHKAVAPPSRMVRWVRLGFLDRALTTPLVQEKKEHKPLAVAAMPLKRAPALKAGTKRGTVVGLQDWGEQWAEQTLPTKESDGIGAFKADPTNSMDRSLMSVVPHSQDQSRSLSNIFKRNNQVLMID
jgi:hypothetical protein